MVIILGLSEKKKSNIAFYLGLEAKELFNSFYIAINKRMFLKDGIFDSSAKKIKISTSNYSHDIKLAWGHPVFLNIFAVTINTSKDDYRYFKLKKRNIKNIRTTCVPIFETDGCNFSLKNELNKNSPEFNKEFLLKVARATPLPGLKPKIMDFLNEDELVKYLSQYDDYDYTLRQIAISKIKNQNFLINIVFNKNECPVVKRAAVSNIKDPYFLIEIILFNSKEYLVIKETFWQICRLCEQGVIDRGIFIEIVVAEELPISIRYNALVRLDDIEVLSLINYKDDECNYYNNDDYCDDTLWDCPISRRIEQKIRSNMDFKS